MMNLLLLLIMVAGVVNGKPVSLSVEGGRISFRVGEDVWLESVGAVVGNESYAGSSVGRTFEFGAMRGRLRSYKNSFIFEQHFPEGLEGTTVWPRFKPSTRRCFTYHGDFPQMASGTLETYQASDQGGLPLVVFDEETVSILSPLENPKAQRAVAVGVGIKTSAPAGWTQRWILTFGSSMRRTFDDWGATVLALLNVTNDLRFNMYRDPVHATIGFWTDNGGYYHYSTGLWPNQTYEQVLPLVKAYHESLGLKFGHWQFDSWFYPKDGGVSDGAVVNWTSLDSVFPSGMAAIQEKLGVPMVMHNRQWSVVSDYIKASSAGVEWLATGEPPNGAAVPRDPAAFFEWFFQQQDGWGLSMYEQDWMCTEYDKVAAMKTNLTLADDWLRGMAAGLLFGANLTQQYCMPYAYDVIAAAGFPRVTNARASNDYFHDKHGRQNWQIGATSLFYTALGILPFKDGFYSSNLPQPGGQNAGPELHPDREIIIATLSAAMVAPMDGLGYMNATRIKASCRADGVVMKPDLPLRPPDVCFFSDPPDYDIKPESCMIYETFTDFFDRRIHYIYFDNTTWLDETMLDDPNPRETKNLVAYNWYTRQLSALPTRLTPGYENHSYALVSPFLNGLAFLGQLDKYAPASRARFFNLSSTPNCPLQLTVFGVNESVTTCAATNNFTLVCETISFSAPRTENLCLHP
ncbi:hypothetical protein CTAYLR_010732 [Chrysophaeum taylorii]|uniref:Uncharacterized protein n=1 Tax=Chrysophaeum taylorii TaxID=2483200 RepID=A0AAD7UKP7_9STRA|nr:hypothetical protein CTAYLR_010732 [Chrysophaeum taylorii]